MCAERSSSADFPLMAADDEDDEELPAEARTSEVVRRDFIVVISSWPQNDRRRKLPKLRRRIKHLLILQIRGKTNFRHGARKCVPRCNGGGENLYRDATDPEGVKIRTETQRCKKFARAARAATPAKASDRTDALFILSLSTHSRTMRPLRPS